MTLRDFKNEINAVRLHDFSEVNADAIRFEGGALVIDVGLTSAVIEERDELLETVASLEKQVTELEEYEKKQELEIEKLSELLDEIKDGSATLLEYRKRAEDADTLRKAWSGQAKRCEEETLMLRKRKGIVAGYFAAQSDILDLLHDMQGGDYSVRVAAILSNIHARE